MQEVADAELPLDEVIDEVVRHRKLEAGRESRQHESRTDQEPRPRRAQLRPAQARRQSSAVTAQDAIVAMNNTRYMEHQVFGDHRSRFNVGARIFIAYVRP